jgi:hypothetical protein
MNAVVNGIRDQVSALRRARASYTVACEVTRSRTVRANVALVPALDAMDRAAWACTGGAIRHGSMKLCEALDVLCERIDSLRTIICK